MLRRLLQTLAIAAAIGRTAPADRLTARAEDPSWVATGYDSGKVDVQDRRSGQIRHLDFGPGAIWNLALLDGRYLAVGRRLATPVYDLSAGVILEERPEPLMGAAPAGFLLVTANLGPRRPALLVFAAPAWGPDLVLPLPAPRVTSWMLFSPDSRYLIVELVPARARDDAELLTPPVDRRRPGPKPEYRLLDLWSRTEVTEFRSPLASDRGAFTADSYILKNSRFDLSNHHWQKR